MSDWPGVPGNQGFPPASEPVSAPKAPPPTQDEVSWATSSGVISLTDWVNTPTIAVEVFRPSNSDAIVMAGSASGVRRLNKRIFGAFFSLASAAMVARFIGLLNQGVISATFGLSPAMAAYFAVQSLPVLLTGLIVSALDVSVIPVYVNAFTKRSARDNAILFSTTLNAILLVTGIITAVLIFFGDTVIHLVAPSLSASAVATARALVPWLFPLVMLNVIAGYLNSILNAREQFGFPAFAAVLIPIAMTVGTLVGVKVGIGILGLAIGFTAGTTLQLIVIFWRATRAKLRYRLALDLRRPELRQIIALGFPVLVSSVLIQANPIVDQIVASTLGDNVISAINYALKIVDIFVVLIFATTARAVFPYFSRQAAVNNIPGLKKTLHLYVWLIGAVTALLAALVFASAPLLVAVLFQHNQFTAQDTALTSTILRGFALGLPAMGLGFILPRVFSAVKRNAILLWLSPISLVVNAGLDFAFARLWGPIGIALSTAFVYTLVVVIELVVLRRMLGPLNLLTPPNVAELKQAGALEGVAGKLASAWLVVARIMQNGAVQGLVALAVFAGAALYAAQDAGRALRLSLSATLALIFVRSPYLLLATWALLNVIGFLMVGDHAISGTLTTISLPTFAVILGLNFLWLARRNPALGPLALFIGWIGIGGLVTIAKHTAPLGAGGFVQAYLVYVNFLGIAALVTLVESRDQLHRLIDMLLLPAIPIALFGVAQTIFQFGGYADGVYYRAQSIFDWSTTLGFYLVIIAPLTIYRAFYSRSPWRLFWMVALGIEVAGIYVSYSRSAEIALAAGALVMLVICGKRSRIAAAVGMALGGVAVAVLGQKLFSRFSTENVGSFNGRTAFWLDLLHHFHPWNLTGNGLGAAQQLIATATLHAYQSPHNTFLEVLYDTGIPGLLFFALALGATLFAAARPQQDDPERRALRGMAAGVIVASALFAVTAPHLIQLWGNFFWLVVSLPFARAFMAPATRPAAPPPVAESVTAVQPVARRG